MAAQSKRLFNEVARTTREASSHYEFNGTPSFVIRGPGGTETLGTPESAEEIDSAIGAAAAGHQHDRAREQERRPAPRLAPRLPAWLRANQSKPARQSSVAT